MNFLLRVVSSKWQLDRIKDVINRLSRFPRFTLPSNLVSFFMVFESFILQVNLNA